MNEESEVVEAVGLEGGKVKCLGEKEEIYSKGGPETEEIELSAVSMFPGFIDSHVHFLDLGLDRLFYANLNDTSSKEELLMKVKEEAREKNEDQWVLGSGWDESKWSDDGEFPTRYELDEVVSDKPVALQRVDMHTFAVNSMGIEKLDIDPSIQGAEKKGGEFTGIFSEDASLEVKKEIAPGEDKTVSALKESVREANRKGATSINQMVVDPGEFRRYFGAYQRLRKEGDLNVRSRVYFTENYLESVLDLGLQSGFGDDILKIGGLKLFTDGSIGSKTAWVTQPFKGESDNYGMSIHQRDELYEFFKKAEQNGIQLAVHAIGDRAMDQVLDCLEELIGENGNHLRHRIEHCEMARDDQIEKMKDLGIIACMQPNFIGQWGLPGAMYEKRFDEDRLSELDRFKVFEENGVPLAFGSDGMPFDPLYGIHWAVNSPFSSQKISPRSAIKAYTLGSAYVGGMEDKVGSIEEGKYADFVLLDGNPIEKPDRIKDMNVEMTILEGNVVYQ